MVDMGAPETTASNKRENGINTSVNSSQIGKSSETSTPESNKHDNPPKRSGHNGSSPTGSSTDANLKQACQTFAYSVALSDSQEIWVTVPIIDKIALTLPVNRTPAELEAIRKALEAMKKASPKAPSTEFRKGSVKYGVRAHLCHAPSGESILVQAAPKSSKVAFLRFEMNPVKLGPAGIMFWREIVTELLALPKLWSPMKSPATVTRIDLACDLVGVGINRLAVTCTKIGKSHAYFALNGKVETVYLGMTGKNAPVTVYNKSVELEEHGQEPMYGDNEHTRVEIHYLPRCSPAALATMSNRFDSVQLKYLPRSVASIAPYAWQHFTDSVRYRGLNAALDPVPEPQKQAYLAGLESLDQSLWKPDTIWSHWGSVLAASGLLCH